MGTTNSKDLSTSTSRSTMTGGSNVKSLFPFHLDNISCDAPPPPLLPPPSLSGNSPPPPPPVDGNGSTSSKSSSKSSSTTQTQTQTQDDISTAAAVPPAYTTNVPNPGPYESSTMPAKRLLSLDTYDGFRIDISKQLSPYMVAIHSFWLGTSMIPDGRNKTYTFISQVADEDGLFMTRVDPEKMSVDGRVQRSLLGGLAMGKLQIAANPEKQGDQMLGEVDLGGQTWTANLKYGSMGGGNVFGLNYYQGVTEGLAMGGEGMYIAANGNLMGSYTMRYEMDAKSGTQLQDDYENQNQNKSSQQIDDISKAAAAAGPIGSRPSSWFLGQINPGQGMLSMLYKRVVTPNRVTLGAELNCTPDLNSQLMLGAEFQLERSKVAMAVDGTGKIQTVLETKLGMAPGSPTFTLNADVDHGKDVMKFGYGLNIGG